MTVRLTFCKFFPDRIAEAVRIYNEEVVPVVQKQKGNLRVRLLEPGERSDDFISITEWKTRADADAYHSGGVYRKLVEKFEGYFMKPPVLKSYSVQQVFEPRHHLL